MRRHSSIRGFTLVELLVTMGLMALLATVSIGGYYGAVRGMTERGAKQDVVSFLRLARQRALVDQVPTAVIFMNRRLSKENLDLGESPRVVGEAIAIRRSGRISYVDGSYLGDEFSDLEKTYPTATSGSSDNSPGMRLYRMQDKNNVEYSVVEEYVERCPLRSQEQFFGLGLKGNASLTLPDGTTFTLPQSIWAFKKKSGGTWKVGDAYGTEIASLRLPHGYVFGSTIPSEVGTTSDGITCFFNPDDATPVGVDMNFSSVEVRAYTPAKGGQQLKKVFTVVKSDLKDDD